MASRISSPHQPLTAYYASENERRSFVGKLFDRTASDYDRIDRLLAPGALSILAEYQAVKPG